MATRGDHAYFAAMMGVKFTVRGEGLKLALTTQTPRFNVADYVSRQTGQSIIEVPSISFDRRPCTIHCKTAHQHVITGLSYRVQIPTTKAAVIIYNVQSYLLRREDFINRMKTFERWLLRSRDVSPQMLTAAVRAMEDLEGRGWEIPVQWYERVIEVAK